MTDAKMDGPAAEIVRAILAEADEQAARTLEHARTAAAVEEERTERDAAEAEAAVMSDAEDEARRLRSRVVATAHVEARQMLLRAREEVIAAATGEIAAACEALRSDAAQYRESLTALAAEAVAAIGGDRVRLTVEEADRVATDAEWMQAVAARVAGSSAGPAPAIEIAYTNEALGGGCTASSPDGRVIFENTYPRRMERLRRRIRAAIVQEVADRDA